MDYTGDSLREAKDWLLDRVDDGARCPCCTQRAQVYRRKVTSRMAFTMLEVYRSFGTDWCHVPSVVTFTGDSGEISKLRYWSLIEESPSAREDGGRAGWWRITPEGEAFVRGRIRIPKYARIYDGRCLGHTGDLVNIRDALGTKFSYDDLMQGV